MELANLKAIARSLMESGRLRDATAIFDQILSRAPDDGYALDALGFLHYQQDRFDRARDYCERALAAEPDNAYAAKGLGLCLVRLDEPDAGIASLERAVSLAPDYLDARHDLVVTLLELERTQDAAAALTAAARALDGLTELPAELADHYRGLFVGLRGRLDGAPAAEIPRPPLREPELRADATAGLEPAALPDIAPTAGVPIELDADAKETP